MNDQKTCVVIGLGYVGLPLALRAAEVGHNVIGIDSSLWKIQALNGHHSYVEDVSDARLIDAAGNFSARLAMHGLLCHEAWDIAIITVPTPLFEDTIEPDLTYVEEAARFIGSCMEPGRTVVLESTTYPGTTEEVVGRIIEERSGLVAGQDFYLGFSPERIDPGNKVHTFETTPKVVSGVNEASLERIQTFYETLVDKTIPVRDPRTAEMTKLVENTFAQVNIAFVNELALVCSKLGLDVDEVLDAAATKGHAFMRFRPGPGVGGHCIPVDPMYLAHHMRSRHESEFRFAELAHEINRSMPARVVERAEDVLSAPLTGKKILLLGATYKPGVSDTRVSPSLDVAKLMHRAGAEIHIADPHAQHISGPVSRVPYKDACLVAALADLTIILTDHDEFDYDGIYDAARVVLDTRNRMGPRNGKVHKL